MKKLMIILIAVVALGCGNSRNQADNTDSTNANDSIEQQKEEEKHLGPGKTGNDTTETRGTGTESGRGGG